MSDSIPQLAESGHALILDASTLETAVETPAGLEGLPLSEEVDDETKPLGKDAKGNTLFAKKSLPIAYYLKEAIRTPDAGKKWTYRGQNLPASANPLEFDVTKEDIDDTVKNFKDRKAAGIKPFVPDTHVDYRDAAVNNGEIIDAFRRDNPDGTHSLITKMKIVGTKGQEKVKANDVSVYLVNGDDKLVVDAYGKKYKGRVLHHVALTPNPNQPHLAPFERIAASADGETRDVPVYTFGVALSGDTMACTPEELEMIKDHMSDEGEPDMAKTLKPETAVTAMIAHHKGKKSKMALSVGLSADKPATLVSILPAVEVIKSERETLRTERDGLKTELAAEKTRAGDAERKVLALSADDPSRLDPMNLAAFEINADTLRENAIKSGAISSADAMNFTKLFRDDKNKPTRLALSASGANSHPLEYNFWRTVQGLATPLKVGNEVPRGVTEAPIPALDATTGQPVFQRGAKMTPERKAELLDAIGLQPQK